MSITTLPLSPIRKFTDAFGLLFRRPPRTQLAALCYRNGESGAEVLLITSRNTRRWIIPKGWPMANYSARKTAKREAFEEAGIVGKVGKEPIGEFPSLKGMGNGFKVRTNIIVFPLKVEQQVTDFPEHGERELAWLPVEKAADICQDEGLSHFLRSPAVKSLLIDKA